MQVDELAISVEVRQWMQQCGLAAREEGESEKKPGGAASQRGHGRDILTAIAPGWQRKSAIAPPSEVAPRDVGALAHRSTAVTCDRTEPLRSGPPRLVGSSAAGAFSRGLLQKNLGSASHDGRLPLSMPPRAMLLRREARPPSRSCGGLNGYSTVRNSAGRRRSIGTGGAELVLQSMTCA
jgi:hypothetical protein